jgi:hypothetical protein
MLIIPYRYNRVKQVEDFTGSVAPTEGSGKKKMNPLMLGGLAIVVIIVLMVVLVIGAACCAAFSFQNAAISNGDNYAGSTYSPTQIYSTSQPVTVGSNKANAAAINEPVHLTGYLYGTKYEADMTITDVVRGETAYNMMQESNMFNGKPADPNMEWFLFKVRFHLSKFATDSTFSITGDDDFHIISNSERLSGFFVTMPPSPVFSGQIYEGATKEGWVAMGAYKNDPTPYIVYEQGSGSNGIWFKTG